MTPSVIKGGVVTFSCSSDANPSVPQSGYSLHKDGHLISSGQNHTVSNIQPPHSGLYSCQAWNNISRSGISRINSTQLHLDVLCECVEAGVRCLCVSVLLKTVS